MNPEYFKVIFLILEVPDKWPENLAIITASNPMDEKLSQEENLWRNKKLLSKFGDNIFFPLSGCSPDFSHQEQSFALKCSLEEGLEIGKEYNQRAIFYVKNDNLELLECKTPISHQLGKFSERLFLRDQKSSL